MKFLGDLRVQGTISVQGTVSILAETVKFHNLGFSVANRKQLLLCIGKFLVAPRESYAPRDFESLVVKSCAGLVVGVLWQSLVVRPCGEVLRIARFTPSQNNLVTTKSW